MLQGENVPNSEKLFSIFEPHTQLYKRGKAAQPVQFGRQILIYEDGAGFISHAYLMPRDADDRTVVVPQTAFCKSVWSGRIRQASFDRGFHSPENQRQLAEIVKHPCVPTREQIEAAAGRFVGRIEQRPSAFSALKIRGRPAYKLARQGKPVELEPRPMDIYRIETNAYQYPELVLEIECGGGTYVHSLGRDLAESLGTAAVMSALERTTRSAAFASRRPSTPENSHATIGSRFSSRRFGPSSTCPGVQLSAKEAVRLRNGLTIEATGEGVPLVASSVDELAAVDPAGQLVGILASAARDQWRSLRIPPRDR